MDCSCRGSLVPGLWRNLETPRGSSRGILPAYHKPRVFTPDPPFDDHLHVAILYNNTKQIDRVKSEAQTLADVARSNRRSRLRKLDTQQLEAVVWLSGTLDGSSASQHAETMSRKVAIAAGVALQMAGSVSGLRSPFCRTQRSGKRWGRV
jgi:hypothetical protein